MFAVLHVAGFPLQAVLRADPATATAFAHAPAALFNHASKRSLVLWANPAARAAGVEPGMSAPQAVARCATLLIRTPDPAAEAEARAALLAAAFAASPAVEATAPGLVTLDLQGLAAPTRPAACHTALAHLGQLGLCATAGLARTPLLALYAARATDRFIAIDNEAAFLAPLPLSHAEPDAELAGILRGWGLRTFGELTAIPRDDLGRRLGAAGVALWDRALGGAPRPLHLATPPQEFRAELEFEDALETLEPLLFVLRRLLDRLALELAAAHRVAVELDLALHLADKQLHARTFRLPEPTGDADILFRTLHTHLESLRTAAPIAAVRLRLSPARPLVRQPGLFETGLRDPHGFAETLARVAALVGADRIGTPQPEDTHRPDAVKLLPPPAVIPPPAPPAPLPPCGRPLRRFRPPLPARLEITDGQPTFVWTDRVQGAVTARLGAWQSSGDWWETTRTWRRTEWDIALADGGLYRLLRTPDGWFLEGEYD